ncbi:tyrosine-type recombinase/integrase [Caproicibacterium argilliputei]|uniref:Tyrosine-type recombinase/integrase n=1 Tax=Caproicibacterium argilliputei TaxID=3030016 RepID=A0AA97D8J9_9FIRM|nr:tyrosine-type recombinase/integrase [Caproicibacterium argilliputei]WOC31662.1 tyrosine-type recombinase/integrase [Caproicibacterium argilliputei]
MICQAIGHIKLAKLQPHHLAELYKNLAEDGMRRDTSYTAEFNLTALLHKRGIRKTDFAKQIGVSNTTLLQVSRKHRVSQKTAAAVCAALGLTFEKAFSAVGKKKLSGNTILHCHNLIKSILSTAVKWQVIPSSPADRVATPKKEHIEQACLDEQQTRDLIAALQSAPINRRTAVILLLCSGMRRSELYGLSWGDIDFDRITVSIHETSVYVPHEGIVRGETKNDSSYRVIKLPDFCLPVLHEYRAWYNEQRLACGDQWEDSGKLFVKWNGNPESPNALTVWFRSFARAHHMPENIHTHSLRHTNATLQIATHQDIRTVASRLGHSQTSTTLNIYAHAIQSADATAAAALDNIFKGNKQQINNK